jgi:hypothetical protein
VAVIETSTESPADRLAEVTNATDCMRSATPLAADPAAAGFSCRVPAAVTIEACATLGTDEEHHFEAALRVFPLPSIAAVATAADRTTAPHARRIATLDSMPAARTEQVSGRPWVGSWYSRHENGV